MRFRRYNKQIVKINSNKIKINAKIPIFQPHKYRGKKIENPGNIAKGLQNFFTSVNSVIGCGGQYLGVNSTNWVVWLGELGNWIGYSESIYYLGFVCVIGYHYLYN